MAFNEIDSFLYKFKHLWRAGLKTSLKVEAENGEASISLTVGLGCVPPPFYAQTPPSQYRSVHRGPAYYRRQERRRQAATATQPAQDDSAEQAQQEVDIENETQSNDLEEVAVEATGCPEIQAEQAENTFNCDLCDFNSKWKNGLRIHMTKKHSKIEQLDGHSEMEIGNDKYSSTKHYWKTGYLGTMYQSYLDAKEVIDESDLNPDDKEKEMLRLLEARKSAFGTNFKHFPPWSDR